VKTAILDRGSKTDYQARFELALTGFKVYKVGPKSPIKTRALNILPESDPTRATG